MGAVELVESLESVRPDQWDELVGAAGGGVFHSHGWLRAYERAAPHHSRPLHLLEREQGLVRAVLPAYLTEGCPRLDAHRRLMVMSPTPLQEPMLLAHSLYAYYGGPLVAPGAGRGASGLLDAFETMAADRGVEVFGLVNVPEHRPDLVRELERRSYFVGYLSSAMVLPVRWSSFDEYLAWLPGKRRWKARTQMRRAAGQGLSVESTRDPGALDALVDLARRTLARHGHGELDLFPSAYLEATVAELGERAGFRVVRGPSGDPLCVVLVLEFGDCLLPWVAGIDYDQQETYETYHCFCRSLIDEAIRRGFREIDMGRGTFRFKRRYGFERRRLFLALNTPRASLRDEVERWSSDLAQSALARHEPEFQSREPAPRSD